MNDEWQSSNRMSLYATANNASSIEQQNNRTTKNTSMSDFPKCAAAYPQMVKVEAGKIYAWCTCGLSEKQPFCDGKHKTIPEEAGGYKSLKVEFAEEQEVWLCQCKQTKNPPYCDGSHKSMEEAV
jgi:CDGSH iron-sulfur domain-containing protein 3